MSINWNMTPHPVTERLIDQCFMRESFYTSIIIHSIYVLILQRFVELITVKIAGHLTTVRKKIAMLLLLPLVVQSTRDL